MHDSDKNCPLVFNLNGKPLNYRMIQYHYEKALKEAGLYSKYSGTHIMRYSMATITREVTGSLDHTQAITGHKDNRMVQKYAALSNKFQFDALKQVSTFMGFQQEEDHENVQVCAGTC